MSLSVSLEEVLEVRGSLLHVVETEAVLLQLLRHWAPHQVKDSSSVVDGQLQVKHILLEATGQVQLHRSIANERWSVCHLASALASVCIGIGGSAPLYSLMDPSPHSVSTERAVQMLKQKLKPTQAARHVSALYSQVLGSSALLNAEERRRNLDANRRGCSIESYSSNKSETEDSAISSDHLSRHPSNDSLTMDRNGTKTTAKICRDAELQAASDQQLKQQQQQQQAFGVFRRRRPIRLARTRSSVADVGGLKNWAIAANAAIHRAPSRLYRLNEQQQSSPQSLLSNSAVLTHLARKTQSFRDLKTSVDREEEIRTSPSAAQTTINCCGPEFIVKSNLAPHVIVFSHPPKKRKAVNILHLNGCRLQVECDPSKTKISHLLQIVGQHFGIASDDSIFFGLSTIRNGNFVFARNDDKVSSLAPENYKQLPYPGFNVYFRFRFYVHSIFTLHHMDSEHLLYLQLRKDVLEQRWTLDPMEEMGLAALALTIEMGPYNQKIHGNGGSYFHVDHYLSAETQRSVNGGELASQALERLHGRIPRLTERRAAESNFIKRIMQTQSYGYHLVHVIEDEGLRTTPLNLQIGLEGLKMVPHPSSGSVSNGSCKHVSLHWDDIKSLTHTKHHIIVSSLAGSSTRKRRLCVGASRCRDTFDLLTSHQKMAIELKNRQMQIRPDLSDSIQRQVGSKLASYSSDESSKDRVSFQPETMTPPAKPPSRRLLHKATTDEVDSSTPKRLTPKLLSSASWTLPRPANNTVNAVRIYVPFDDKKKNSVEKEADVTTRLIEVKSDDSVPELLRMTSISPVSCASRCDSSTATSPRKSTLVRMGTKISSDALIREKMRFQELVIEPVVSNDPSGAYVVDTSVKSEDESFSQFDAHESISTSLCERFNQLPQTPLKSSPSERAVTVRFNKDADGSLGILIARGIRGGIYLMGINPNGPAHRQTSLQPGDRILAVNGVDCDELDYDAVIDHLRNVPGQVELLVVRPTDLSSDPSTLMSYSARVKSRSYDLLSEHQSLKSGSATLDSYSNSSSNSGGSP